MRREVLLLKEMIDAAVQAMEIVRGRGVDDLLEDRLRRDALLWNFTVLGEAASQLPASFRAERSEVNWARPAQLRNRIVHGYWSADIGILVDTAELHLPGYVRQIRAILELLEREGG